ncbi:XRE family transcriptional regulator [Capillimicrobium parvum]|nr:XRE family transcriptional regulator [Capillimicrobium parvum]
MDRGSPDGPTTTASTGVAGLDAALHGLFWGDNVVWEVEEGGSLDAFLAAMLRARAQFDRVVFITVESDPEPLCAACPGAEVVDARPGCAIETAGELLSAVRERVQRATRTLVVFDSLDALSDRWGHEVARRFFTRACPILLGLWAVAYWSLTPGRHSVQLRQAVDAVTQCVLVLGPDRLRIAKAEGRPRGVQGGVFMVRTDGRVPSLEPAPTAARLAAALRAVRIQRHLSQGELARLAGVSPSAISQAERGRRGLALSTLLDLTSRLDMTIDELLRGEIALGYRLSRRAQSSEAAARLVPLFDDPGVGLRASLSCLAPGQTVRAPEPHRGVELIAVASGLVQVILPTGRPVLRQGETLLVECTGVTGWGNVGDQNAVVFWVLRDDVGPIRSAWRPEHGGA